MANRSVKKIMYKYKKKYIYTMAQYQVIKMHKTVDMICKDKLQ